MTDALKSSHDMHIKVLRIAAFLTVYLQKICQWIKTLSNQSI